MYEHNHHYGGQDRPSPRGRRIPREGNDDGGRRPGVGRQFIERQALEAQPRPGPPMKLTQSQHDGLRRLLVAGPRAAGFSTELRTCARVAEMVRREFGVEYHPDHLGRILHDLGFSPQKPQRRAAERNEAVIER